MTQISKNPRATTGFVTQQEDSESKENNQNGSSLSRHSIQLSNTNEQPANVLSKNSHLKQGLETHNELSIASKKISQSKENALNSWKNNWLIIGLITRLREYLHRWSIEKEIVRHYQQEKLQLEEFRRDILANKQAIEDELAKLNPVPLSDKIEGDLLEHTVWLLSNNEIEQQRAELQYQIEALEPLEGHISSLINEINNKKVQEIDAPALQEHMDAMLSFIYSAELKYAKDFNSMAVILRERLIHLENNDLPGISVTVLLQGALEKLEIESGVLNDNKAEMEKNLAILQLLPQQLEKIIIKQKEATQAVKSTEEAIDKQNAALSALRDTKNNLMQLFDDEKEANDEALKQAEMQEEMQAEMKQKQTVKHEFKEFFARVRDKIANKKPENSEGKLDKFSLLDVKIREILQEFSQKLLQASFQKALQVSFQNMLQTVDNLFEENEAALTLTLKKMEKAVVPAEIQNHLLSQYLSVIIELDAKISPELERYEAELKNGLNELQATKEQKVQEREVVLKSGQIPLQHLKEVLPSAVWIDEHGIVQVHRPTLNNEIAGITTAIKEIEGQSRELEALEESITKAYQSAGVAVPAG